ncbi:MAG: hypothetical protein R2762_01810 [Bryobacteraceae bacterium]
MNAASFQPGIVAGSLFTVFGSGFRPAPGVTGAASIPLPTVLDEVAVTVNGIAVPLLAVANGNGQEQINAQAPFTLSGDTVAVTVRRAGATGNSVEVPRLDAQPAIFTSGGPAIVVRAADNTLVTPGRPARRDEFVYFYANGLGAVDSPPLPGQGGPSSPLARLRAPVTVTLDGVPCEVQFAGLAPGLVGVYQVNVRVAAAVPPGTKPLVIAVGGVSSPAAMVPVE